MKRIKFRKNMQRKFLKKVIENLNCFSLRGLLQHRFDIPYSTLKNYYTEKRTLPETFFKDLCYISRINPTSFKISYLDNNWGQIKGGKKSKRK